MEIYETILKIAIMRMPYLVVHDSVDKNGDAVFCENLQRREHQNILSLSCIIIIVLIMKNTFQYIFDLIIISKTPANMHLQAHKYHL